MICQLPSFRSFLCHSLHLESFMAYEIPLRSPGVPALSLTVSVVTSYPVEKRLVPENPREWVLMAVRKVESYYHFLPLRSGDQGWPLLPDLKRIISKWRTFQLPSAQFSWLTGFLHSFRYSGPKDRDYRKWFIMLGPLLSTLRSFSSTTRWASGEAEPVTHNQEDERKM